MDSENQHTIKTGVEVNEMQAGQQNIEENES